MAFGQKLQFMKLVFYFAALKVAVNGEYEENFNSYSVRKIYKLSFGFQLINVSLHILFANILVLEQTGS